MRSKSVIIYYKLNPDNSQSRLGISASKKFGNAIKRNSFKRIIRENFRLNKLRNNSFDILVVANNRFSPQKEPLDERTKRIIHSDINKLFKEISIKS